MDAKDFYCKRLDVTEPYKEIKINSDFMFQLMEEYTHLSHHSDFKYCPYCGELLRGKIETIVGSPMVCKNTMCKQSLSITED